MIENIGRAYRVRLLVLRIQIRHALQKTKIFSDGAPENLQEQFQNRLLQEENLLEQVEAALDRIDAGTFGRCGCCGNTIPGKRLESFPYAENCLDCASTRAKVTS